MGSSGVLFVALVAGHFGLHVPDGIADVGTATFVYCVGLGVGNRFFGSLKSRGKYFILLSVVVVGAAWLTAWALGAWLHLDAGMLAGLFAGACTSTPALAAAIESQGAQAAGVNIGYAVAYPFGVVGVVLFVQLLPRLLRQNLDAPTDEAADSKRERHAITARAVHVTNPELVGKHIGSSCVEINLRCRITRIVRGDAFIPLQEDDCFVRGGEVLMVGELEDVEREMACLGHSADTEHTPRFYADERADLIVLSREVCNETLRELDTLGRFGIVVSRVTRLGVTFIPTADFFGVLLQIVGLQELVGFLHSRCGCFPYERNGVSFYLPLRFTGGGAMPVLAVPIPIPRYCNRLVR